MSRKSLKAVLLTLATVMLTAAIPAAESQTFKGYCSCGCSFVKSCNTDADCGSGRCLKGPTCC